MAREIPLWQLDRWRERHPGLLECEGFESALVGLCERAGPDSFACLVYDYQHCVDLLMDRDRMSLDAAEEYMIVKTTDELVGPYMPAFIDVVAWEEDW
jgi:hypothetical protein